MLKQICAACVGFSLVFAIGAHAKEMQKRSNFDDSGAELDTVVIDADDRALDAGVRAIVDRFGQGVKSLTGESRNLKTCVDAKFRVPDTIHVSAHTMLTIVKTAQEFQEATSFEASASTRFLSFSGSASAKLERSTQQNQSTLLVIARTFVNADNPVVIVEEKLSAQAKAAYTKSPDLFYAKCGDAFVQKIDLGAEFMAIMTFESKEGADFSKATVHVEAAVASTAFSSTYNDEIRTASSDSTLRIESFNIGGSSALPKNDLDDISQAGVAFGSNKFTIANMVPVAETTKDYATIDFDVDGVPADVVANAKVLDDKIAKTKAALDWIDGVRADWANNVLPVNKDDLTILMLQRVGVKAQLGVLQILKNDCAAHPFAEGATQPGGHCAILDAVAAYQLPKLRPHMVHTVVDGNSGRVHFADIPVTWTAGMRFFARGTYCPPNGSGCVTPEYAGPLGLSLPGDYKTGFPLVIQAPNVGTLWAWEYVQQGRPPLTGYVDGRWVHDGSDATGSMDIFVY